MTIMSFLLLIILFLAFFIHFSGINPEEVTVFFYADYSITTTIAILVVAAVLLGICLGFMVHSFHIVVHQFSHWKVGRRDKKGREIAAIYREGVGKLLSGDLKKAHATLQKALDKDNSRTETHIAMASVLIEEGNPQEGVTMLLKAKSIDPKSLEVLFKLATTYQKMGQHEEAVKAYERILEIESDNRKALRALRDLHMSHDRWKAALDLQKQILKVGPGSRRMEDEKKTNLYLRYEVARLSLEEEEGTPDIKGLQEIIKQAPDFAPARVTLGDAFKGQERIEEAAKAWQQGYKALSKSIFLSRLEDLYMQAEDPATLLAFYRSSLQERGNDLMFRLFFGKLCLRLEMVEEAMEQLFAVENAGVESPQLHLLLAEAHRRRDRTEESINEYQKALGIDSQLRLGYVCESCGKTTADWQSRCQECGEWGSCSLAGRQMIVEAKPVEIRGGIYHGERA